ncbi:MAG: hypothetical protein HC941_15495, partial [Microcoleus sp. SU_5_3]|nr:hypothetical protein [Microcoleus sp. SU_5_3]
RPNFTQLNPIKKLPQYQLQKLHRHKYQTSGENPADFPAQTEGEVQALAPASPNLIQPKTSPVPPQEIISPQPEIIGENSADFAAKTGGEMEAIAPASPNLIQAKNSSILPQETVSLPSETRGEIQQILLLKLREKWKRSPQLYPM